VRLHTGDARCVCRVEDSTSQSGRSHIGGGPLSSSPPQNVVDEDVEAAELPAQVRGELLHLRLLEVVDLPRDAHATEIAHQRGVSSMVSVRSA